jgi:hypothetical protein
MVAHSSIFGSGGITQDMIDQIQNTQNIACVSGSCPPRKGREQQQQTQTSGAKDTVRISNEGREQLKGLAKQPFGINAEDNLDPEQKKEVENLKKRDQEVKAHEQAHLAAGSGVVMGGANYEYQRGPDGKMYAVGGEVKIDTSRENSPARTISKMQQVKRAALAPAQPSAQDRSVAAQAAQIEADARSELAKETTEAVKDKDASDPFTGQASGSAPTGDTSPTASAAANPASRGATINIVV